LKTRKGSPSGAITKRRGYGEERGNVIFFQYLKNRSWKTKMSADYADFHGFLRRVCAKSAQFADHYIFTVTILTGAAKFAPKK
jgi:hypothetical protein